MNLDRKLKSTATYWAITGYDRYGKPTFSSPATKTCRWENKTENVQGKAGDTIVSKARVFLAETVDIDGYLFEGESSAADPTKVEDAAEIQALGSMPNLRNSTTLYVAYL